MLLLEDQRRRPIRMIVTSIVNPIATGNVVKCLLKNFADNILPLLVLTPGSQYHSSAGATIRQPKDSDGAYFHGCLTMSALLLKEVSQSQAPFLKVIISQLWIMTIDGLREAVERKPVKEGLFQAKFGNNIPALGNGSARRPDLGYLWARSLQGHDANLRAHATLSKEPSEMSSNRALISWIDILGSAMRGCTTHFPKTYRTNYVQNYSIGLQQMMGCDDRTVYLIENPLS